MIDFSLSLLCISSSVGKQERGLPWGAGDWTAKYGFDRYIDIYIIP